jgi:3-dehydroquinate dehydratase II
VVEVLTVGAKDRAGWVKKSLLRDVAAARVSGAGPEAYLAGLDRLGAMGAARKSLGRTAAVSPSVTAQRKAAPPSRTLASSPAPDPLEPPRSAAAPAAAGKTLGRRGAGPSTPPERPQPAVSAALPASEQGKTLGRERPPSRAATPGRLTRAEVRSRIADRLAGRLTPGALATWARGQWVAMQQGAPVESGQRELLDEVLQALFLAVQPRGALAEDQLVEWMTALE